MFDRKFNCYVVKIIDEYETIHFDDSTKVKKGDKIKVIEPGPEVIDPINSKSLGFLDYTKEELEIVELFDKMSICRKVKIENKNQFTNVLSPMFFGETTINNEKLNVNIDQINPVIYKDEPIKIGDPVIFIN
ncbi:MULTISPECIES: hypothetical protein [Lactobacillales]|uniref:hypothetical protein n=1 Tax=Lactobacillales TaxID=186826 RepID=UPI00165B1100|nr:hypothetical protein [Carnobacterium maltaromaticum]MBC9810082.1 hypothetical protein [Carnobacterium maltaromaticum]